jgi:hypothetical protein
MLKSAGDPRSLVASQWPEKTGTDFVFTTLDHVQTKEKILSLIANILELEKQYPLGRARTATG